MNQKRQTRRDFIQVTGMGMTALSLPALTYSRAGTKELYSIGLSMYSLRFLFRDGKLTALDYPAFARDTFGIKQLDVWDGGFPEERKKDPEFFRELRKSSEKAGTNIFLLMAGAVDARGETTDERMSQSKHFHEPVDNAVILGCKYVRIFLKAPDIGRDEAVMNSIEALAPLVKYAEKRNIALVIEPGASEWAKQGDWLAQLAGKVSSPYLRLMPDFGKMKDHDPYGGTKAMMPYTEVVSAKSHNFDKNGDEVDFDYRRLMKTVVDAGFRGIVAIEYEGKELGPVEGVRATQHLLQSVRKELS